MEAERPYAPNSRRDRFVAMLRGGARPVNLTLAVALGLAIGFTAGWNFTVLALLMLAALGNANSKLLTASALAGALLAWLAAPVTSSIGALVFDETQFGSWLGMLGDGPLVAMFDLDCYCLVGGLILAFLLAGPLGRAAWQVGESYWVDEEPAPDRRREGLLRPQAWLALPIVLLLGGVLPWWIGVRHLEHRILALLSDFNGAEVSATRIHLEPWTGQLELDALQIPDPANLERDRLRIAHVRAKLQGGPLLRGRLEIEHLHLTGIDRDVARRKAATAVTTRIPQIRFSPAPLALPADPSQELELHDYVRGWDKFAARLSHLGQLLGTLERIRSLEPDRLERASSATLIGSAARSNFGHPQPALSIEQTAAEGFGESWGIGHKSLIEVAHLSTNPKLAKSPPSLRIVLPELSAEVQSTVDFLKPGERHRVQLQVGDLPLVSLVEQSSGGSRVAVEDGRISISGEGWMDDSRFDLALQIQITALKARMQGSEPAAGITPAAWNRGLRDLGGFGAELTCDGRWTSPQLRVQGRDLVNQFKHQLRSAGDHSLLALIEEQLATPAAPAMTPVVITDSLPSPVELPHPLPDPSAGAPLATPISTSVDSPHVERLPQPSPAPAAMLDADPRAAVPIAPLQPTTVSAKNGEPRTAPAVASDGATPLAQPLEQPGDVQRENTPQVATIPDRTGAATPRPARGSSGIVTVSDELFGPPPMAVPAVGRDLVMPGPAVAPVWQPPPSPPPPTYRAPQAPVVSYAPPTSPAVPTYSRPPATTAPAKGYYAPPANVPMVTHNTRSPANTSSASAMPVTMGYAAPPTVELPPSGAGTVSPSATSYRSSRSESGQMPGPINMQLGLDDGARSVNPSSMPAPAVASKRRVANKPAVPTPKELLAQNPTAGPTFFRQASKPRTPPSTVTNAPPTGDPSATETPKPKIPWYKRIL